MILRLSTALDRSPRTGQLALDPDLSMSPLHGWLEGSLDPVDPPLCEDYAPPSSQDPVFPGVRVLLPGDMMSFLPTRPKDAPLLLVGTLSNPRAVKTGHDGCGFGMTVQGMDLRQKDCIAGRWEPWGLKAGGLGSFTLCKE
jgi:hypothetical protein